MPLLLPRDPSIARASGLSSRGTVYPTHLLVLVIALCLIAFKYYEFRQAIGAEPLDRYIYPALGLILAGEVLFVAYAGSRVTRILDALTKLSDADPISGCYTGDALTSMVEREVARAGRAGRALAILMIDVAADGSDDDDPARVHDLREMTRVIRESTRNSDVLGQFQPGELALLLPDTPADHASVVVAKLRSRFDVAASVSDPSRLNVKLVTARQAADGKGIVWHFNDTIERDMAPEAPVGAPDFVTVMPTAS